MKTAFFDDGDMGIGSTRIWIYNLAGWFSQLGIETDINPSDSSDYDVIIFGKNLSLKKIKSIMFLNKKALYGNINPGDFFKEKKTIMKLCHFFIVGSIEEKAYYSNYSKNVFIFPLIEKIFNNKKVHSNKDTIVLGYHGNKMHLEEFSPHIQKAIEKVAKRVHLKMIAVYDIKNLGKWKIGRPKINIKDIQWDISTIEKNLLRSDIGLVPSTITLGRLSKKILFFAEKILHPKLGFENDILIRFKNNTNSGRAFVFHQLNIPVISDFSPSNFHIMGNPDCGYISYGNEGWTNSLLELATSFERRRFVAENAYKEFGIKYDPLKWAKKLFQNILTLYNDRSNQNKRYEDILLSNEQTSRSLL